VANAPARQRGDDHRAEEVAKIIAVIRPGEIDTRANRCVRRHSALEVVSHWDLSKKTFSSALAKRLGKAVQFGGASIRGDSLAIL
jgi:hypothetical protein